MKYLLSALLSCFVQLFLMAQTDFNQYKPLQSFGQVPPDFSTPTKTKVAQADLERLSDLTRKERERFVVEVNYTIDELLQSGWVTFGDPVSVYLQQIGNRLTMNDTNLVGKLRFYTFNSNEANAFSTDQGMVFVTTGLIAQLTSEAQLAFVLAHEIVHYQEKHVVDLYDYATSNSDLSYGEKVRFFTKYSRENEFEADKKGLKMYHDAGYAASEIATVFDVLVYSYLPFEEIVFSPTYFNSEQLFVPEFIFNGPKIEITATERYNDRFSSHPNVSKRTEELEKEVKTMDNWGDVSTVSQAKFDEIRTICRFEFVLNHIYANNPIDALYGIYILEQNFPDSRFLKNAKSQVWLELMKHEKRKSNFKFDNYFTYDKEFDLGYEGQISVLATAIAKLPKEALVAMGLRIIQDNFERDTTDHFAQRLANKSIELAAMNEEFEFDRFSKFNFQEAIADCARQKVIADSIAASSGKTAQIRDKYLTIRNQKSGIRIDQNIDSTKFYLYAISDLVKDSNFIRKFENYVVKSKAAEKDEDEFFNLTDDEQFDFNQEKYKSRLHIDADTLLMINPIVYDVKSFNQIDYPASDVLEAEFLAVMSDVSKDVGITLKQLDRSNQEKMTALDYNDLSCLMRSIDRRIQEKAVDVFLLDAEMLDTLAAKYHSDKLMLIEMDHLNAKPITWGSGILFSILLPVGLVYFPIALLTAHTTEYRVFVLDLNSGELLVHETYYANERASKKMMNLRLNALFNQLKQSKDEK
jgi:hypothetical protein